MLFDPSTIRLVRRLLGAVFLLLLTACASKSYVVLIPNADGTVGKVIVRGEKGEQVLNVAGQSATIDGKAMSGGVDNAQIKQDFGDTIAAQPKIPVRFLLYFTSGITLTPSSEKLIPEIIAEAGSRAAVDLSVIGHTDTIQTPAFNDQLALNRAKRVAELLMAGGLKANSLSVESHGKRNLLILTPDNTLEPKNRRVEVSVR